MSYLQSCMGITTKQKRCKNIAGKNGFCHVHGKNRNLNEEEFMEEKSDSPTADLPPTRRLKVCICDGSRYYLLYGFCKELLQQRQKLDNEIEALVDCIDNNFNLTKKATNNK